MNPFEFYRKQAGLNQEEAAKQLSINRSTISKWETGAALPTVKRLIQAAALYGCRTEDLIRETPPALRDTSPDRGGHENEKPA